MTAQEAYDKTEKLVQAYSQGDLLGGNPMQYIEQYAKEYHALMVKKLNKADVKKSVCDHTDENGNVAQYVCIKCGKRLKN